MTSAKERPTGTQPARPGDSGMLSGEGWPGQSGHIECSVTLSAQEQWGTSEEAVTGLQLTPGRMSPGKRELGQKPLPPPSHLQAILLRNSEACLSHCPPAPCLPQPLFLSHLGPRAESVGPGRVPTSGRHSPDLGAGRGAGGVPASAALHSPSSQCPPARCWSYTEHRHSNPDLSPASRGSSPLAWRSPPRNSSPTSARSTCWSYSRT